MLLFLVLLVCGVVAGVLCWVLFLLMFLGVVVVKFKRVWRW